MAASLIPGLGPREHIPRVRSNADLARAGLNVQEGWVLSRVDGHTSFGQLCLISGLGEPQTVEILRRLLERGLIASEGFAFQEPLPPASAPPLNRVPASAPRPSAAPALSSPPIVAPASAAQVSAPAHRGEQPSKPPPQVKLQVNDDLDNLASRLAEAEARLREHRVAVAQAEAEVATIRAELAQAEAQRLVAKAAETRATSRPPLVSVPSSAHQQDHAPPAVFAPELASAAKPHERSAQVPAQVTTWEETREQIQTPDPAPALGHELSGEASQTPQASAFASASAQAATPMNHEVSELLRSYAREDAPSAPGAEQEFGYTRSPSAKRSETNPGAARPRTAPARHSGPGLSAELEQRISHKHSRLSHDDLFELLEVELTSDKRELKRAYFRLSKEFHPDRYYGKDLGPHRERLGDIFKAISQASEFLSDEARCQEYRQMIEKQRELIALEVALERAVSQALDEDRRLAERELGAPSAGSAAASSSESPAMPIAEPTPVGRASASQPGARAIPSAEAKTPSTPPHAKAAPRRLLRQMLNKKMVDDRGTKSRRYFTEGMRQMELKQWTAAASNLKLAATFEPDNREYEAKWKEAERQFAALQGGTHFERGGFEERAGRSELAAWHYVKAAELGALVPAAPWAKDAWPKAAEMYLRSRRLEKAEEYGIKATERAPSHAASHRVLARVLKERRQFGRALQAVKRAMELDPGNQDDRVLLDEVGKLA